jgi:hypothetical protein
MSHVNTNDCPLNAITDQTFWNFLFEADSAKPTNMMDYDEMNNPALQLCLPANNIDVAAASNFSAAVLPNALAFQAEHFLEQHFNTGTNTRTGQANSQEPTVGSRIPKQIQAALRR